MELRRGGAQRGERTGHRRAKTGHVRATGGLWVIHLTSFCVVWIGGDDNSNWGVLVAEAALARVDRFHEGGGGVRHLTGFGRKL